jgi:hypothetical protein
LLQNADFNFGTLLGTSPGQPFAPIPEPQLRNTIIFLLGDNGSPHGIALAEEKEFIYEGSASVPFLVSDGNAVMNEIKSETIAPRFLDASRLDTRNEEDLVNAVDIYITIPRLADPSVVGPSNTDSMDFRSMFTTVEPPTVLRSYNFAQWYTPDGTEKRATIRNSGYKLNYDMENSPDDYSLYQYVDGEIPGREDDDAVDIYDDAVAGGDPKALDNLNELLDELISNYKRDMDLNFPDPPWRAETARRAR